MIMLSDGPAADVIEISVFGPGVGESIVAHLGQGDWIIVDSCIDSRGRATALEYLRLIGVDAASAVRLVVATHAHDDHFDGISDIVSACTSADFVLSAAGTKEEHLALLALDEKMPFTGRRSAIEEYRKIYEAIEARGRNSAGIKCLRYALENGVILRLRSGRSDEAVIRSLSPSSEAITRARTSLMRQVPVPGEEMLPRRPIDPNELAIALWIDVGEKAVLLGADLLNGPPGCGWRAAVENFIPRQRASVFKIAHHGSPNAHYDLAWQRFLIERPIGIIAPYRAGPQPRPSVEDQDRICGLVDAAYLTAPLRETVVDDVLARETADLGPLARNVRNRRARPGHVRARSAPDQNDWSIDVDLPAYELCRTAMAQ